MIHKFTDSEYAVMLDSLAQTRDRIRKEHPEIATPNIDSAMAKMSKWGSPMGCEFLVVTGVDYWLLLGANGDPDYDEAKYQAAVRTEEAA